MDSVAWIGWRVDAAGGEGAERCATASGTAGDRHNLDREGMAPWHMKMSFELNDLNGNPKEQGTIEEWWTSRKSRKLVIASPSCNVTFSGSVQPGAGRESYLVRVLLD